MKAIKIPPRAVKLGFDPCSDSLFFGAIDADGQLTIWGKSKRDGRVWTALGPCPAAAKIRAGHQHGPVSPFLIRELG